MIGRSRLTFADGGREAIVERTVRDVACHVDVIDVQPLDQVRHPSTGGGGVVGEVGDAVIDGVRQSVPVHVQQA